MAEATQSEPFIAFQGVPGAYSDMACRAVYPDLTTLPCPDFEDTFAAVADGRARLAMIPIENSSAGRVADIHHLLPESGLHIIGEHFQRVDHHLAVLSVNFSSQLSRRATKPGSSGCGAEKLELRFSIR